MKTLAEINAERQEIIKEGLNNISRRKERGVIYSAEEVSKMSGGLIPASNLQACFERARLILSERYRCSERYLLFGWIACTPVIENRTFTYKVYDENGELVKTYTKNKPITRIKF